MRPEDLQSNETPIGPKLSAPTHAQTDEKKPESVDGDFDAIAEKYTAELRAGNQLSIAAFLDACRNQGLIPDVSGQQLATLQDLLRSVQMLEGIKSESEAVPSSMPTQFDGYQLLREIGRGGMGVVYEALHQSLGRRVAIKVLGSSLLGESKHLARFRIEARAAAKLRHPNIVPVFGVGQNESHHYMVMDFIEGLSLREVVWQFVRSSGDSGQTVSNERRTYTRELTAPTQRLDTNQEHGEDSGDFELALPSSSPSAIVPQQSLVSRSKAPWFADVDVDSAAYFDWVASSMSAVCSALDYAHQQGVLHRDVKPANLLVDRNGQIWVADFGLAKLAEQQTMTNTGEVLGTPQYMPPESFNRTYDERSEVYALGLTLYELLARRPAIEGKTAADTVRKATLAKIEAPSRFNSQIPVDLETITLKALESDPAGRYQTAAELHADLQRFLSQSQIEAKRPGIVGRTISWIRREPVLASLALSIIGLLTLLLIVGGWSYWRTDRLLEESQQARATAESSLEETQAALVLANQQQRRAEANLQVALRAFEDVMRNVAERGSQVDAEVLGDVTDTTAANVGPEDAELLKSLLGFLDQLASNNDESLLAESALAASRAGDIYVSLGELRNAGVSYYEARERYQRLLKQDPDQIDHQLHLLTVLNNMASIATLRGDLALANSYFVEAQKLFQRSELRKTPEGRFEGARTQRLFASLPSRAGVLASLPSRPNATSASNSDGLGRRALSWIREEMDRTAIDRAIELLEGLVAEYPDEIRYRVEMARALRCNAEILFRSGERRDSEAAIGDSIATLEKLVQDHPESDGLRYELALTLVSLETVGFNQMFRAIRAMDLSEQLLAKEPRLPRYIALKALTLENRAILEKRARRNDLSARHFSQAAKMYAELVEERSEVNVYQTHRIRCLEMLGELSLVEGQKSQARDYFQQAMDEISAQSGKLSNPDRIQKQRLIRRLQRIAPE